MENKEEKRPEEEKAEDQKNEKAERNVKGPGHFIVWAVVILVVASIITLATIMWDDEDRRDARNILAKVEGEKITMQDIRPELDQVKKQYADQGMDISGDKETEYMITLQILQNHINQRVLLAHAKKLGLEVSNEDIQEQYEMIKDQFEVEADFETALKQAGLTKKELEENIKNDLTIRLLIMEEAGIVVTDEEIEEYYEQLLMYIGEDLPPLEEIRIQIEQELQNEKMQDTLMFILEDLKKEYEIEILMEAPKPSEPEIEIQEEFPDMEHSGEEMEMIIEE